MSPPSPVSSSECNRSVQQYFRDAIYRIACQDNRRFIVCPYREGCECRDGVETLEWISHKNAIRRQTNYNYTVACPQLIVHSFCCSSPRPGDRVHFFKLSIGDFRPSLMMVLLDKCWGSIDRSFDPGKHKSHDLLGGFDKASRSREEINCL